eukprot:gb/GECH01006164.1/.p1 GENE.gb/GECH01006164.1/~~gb/GECH01006164.1/.p1  ORF type:complete len:163 (+),score=11.76 gb/GECH01006164.1/:1-489(+)
MLEDNPPFNYTAISHVPVHLPYSHTISSTGDAVARSIGRPYICVHVRRGDKVRTDYSLRAKTDVPAINATVARYLDRASTTYIMTDEVDETYLRRLKTDIEGIQVLLYSDFPDEFSRVLDDNYALFLSEYVVMQRANVRISTFRVEGSRFYDTYLYSKPGFQ